jgi:hypothetical protein
MITDWINAINTTSLRIVASLALALLCVPMVLLAMLWFAWGPTADQLKVLIGLAGFVLTMMGFDVLQFVGKRFSDAEYVTAKKGPSPVTVEAPSTVSVTALPSEAPARRADAVPAIQAAVRPIDPAVPIGAHIDGEGD